MSGEARLVLVTGGSGEIGGAIVRALLSDGFRVEFTYRSGGAAAAALAASSGSAAPPVPIACDLADPDSLDSLCGRVSSASYYGFVHAAGIACDSLVAGISAEAAHRTMAINFWSYVFLAKHLVRGMSRARAGRIVAISSVVAGRGNRGNAIYAASKAALEGFNRAFATEYANKGITVNAIAPGYVATAMIAGLPALKERVAASVPAARLARPEDVSGLASFLLSERGAYVTGSVLPVDGGLSSSLGA